MNYRPTDLLDIAQEYSQRLLEQHLHDHKARQEKLPDESEEYCVDCDVAIPEARRVAVKGCQRCIQCQEQADRIAKGVLRGAW